MTDVNFPEGTIVIGSNEQMNVHDEEEEEDFDFDEEQIAQLARPTLRSRIENNNIDGLFAALKSVEVVGVESSTHGRCLFSTHMLRSLCA